MSEKIVTEIVEFKLEEYVNEDEFLKTVDFLEKNFHLKQKGFIDTELIKGKDERTYIMIQHWETMKDCKNVVRKMMQEPLTEDFRKSINSKTVKMTLSSQIKRWS